MLALSALLMAVAASAAPITNLLFSDAATYTGPTSSVSNITIPLAGRSNLTLPAGQVSEIITLGRGVQNYTCTNGTYTSVGAVASFYDVGKLFQTPGVDVAKLSATLPPLALQFIDPERTRLPVAIDHFFVKLPGATAISPGFFGKTDQVIGSKRNSQKAPVNPAANVDWLDLKAVDGQGTLSNSVYRIDTAGGQPPATCSVEGNHLSVPYSAMYWFTK